MEYITFAELLKIRGSKFKFSSADVAKQNFDNNYHKNLHDPELGIMFEKNSVLNKNFFVKTNDNYLIKDLGYKERIPSNPFFDLNQENIPILEGEYFLLGGDTNYYHWILNWLPRLFLYELANLNCKIIVNNNFNIMQKKVLETLFPWCVDKIVKLERVYKVEKLYIPNFFLNPIHSPFAIRCIRSRLMSLYFQEINVNKYSKNIFISRYKAKTRKIINEDKLMEILDPLGFEKYFLEDLNFIDQVNLFFHAEKIISPHGAGLTNLLFCNNKPKVVEIINDHYTTVFWSLGFFCGSSRYDIYKAIPLNESHQIVIHRDMEIDLEQFLSKFNQVLD